MLSQCLISFGSNLGDRGSEIAAAAKLILASGKVESFRTSRLFETPAIGGPQDQAPFLNAVAAFDTQASATEILAVLQQIEQQLGRQRLARWGARRIDLDVILHGDLVGGGRGLIVPHPRYTARRFVLLPACDVASDYRDPRFGWTLRQLTDHLASGTPSLALCGGEATIRDSLCQRLSNEFGIRTFADHSIPATIPVIGNVPGPVWHTATTNAFHEPPRVRTPALSLQETNVPWVAAFVPPLPNVDPEVHTASNVPRLVARLQWATKETRWPAPHQIWPNTWSWPEYRLEIDDLHWASQEIVSALQSMHCDIRPVTDDGNWWQSR